MVYSLLISHTRKVKEITMRKRFTLALTLILIAALFVTVGCKKEEAPAAQAPAPVEQKVEAAAPAAPVEPAIDEEAVLLSAAQDFFAAIPTSNNIIASADVKQMLEDNPDAIVIIDIRSDADFEEGHIEGAYHSAWADLGSMMAKIPTNRQVVVTCYSGQTAGQAVGTLRLAGFNNVKSLKGGMNNGWKAEGLPTDGTGANPLSSRRDVTEPKNEEQQVLWEAAKATFEEVRNGNNLIDSQALYDNIMAFNLIDIRGAEDFAKGHIEGAKNIPMAKIGEAIPSFSTNRKIAITCYSGQTAGQTVGVLRSLGFDAYSLKGGMNNGYLTTDLPVVQ